jgi:hypothetical protein
MYSVALSRDTDLHENAVIETNFLLGTYVYRVQKATSIFWGFLFRSFIKSSSFQ